MKKTNPDSKKNKGTHLGEWAEDPCQESGGFAKVL
jgi:hypothetical protein